MRVHAVHAVHCMRVHAAHAMHVHVSDYVNVDPDSPYGKVLRMQDLLFKLPTSTN